MNYPTKSTISLATAMGCLALAAGSANAALITVGDGLTVTASDYLTTTPAWYLDSSIDGTGLTGNQHGTGNRSGWLSDTTATNTIADDWIQFDLGDAYVLSTIQVWNNNQSQYQGSGINQLDIYVSSSATDPGDPEGAGSGNWTLWKADATFAVGPISSTYTGFDLATAPGVATALPTGAVRWVRFEVDTNQVGGGITSSLPLNSALSEIQFNGAPVPEPTTTALLGLGGLALILRRRK